MCASLIMSVHGGFTIAGLKGDVEVHKFMTYARFRESWYHLKAEESRTKTPGL
jgi:hypothetical protein